MMPKIADSRQIEHLQTMSQLLRREVAKMFYSSTNGHYGGCFSCAEIIASLFFHVMRINPEAPQWADRDRFVISKGHCAATMYAALAHKGFFPMKWLDEYEKLGAHLNAHPNMLKIPGCDMSTGALGHGLSVCVGMALAAKIDNKNYITYCLLGDGECHEGQIWEAAMSAQKFKLDNLIAIVDRNKLCVTGDTDKTLPLEPFETRWEIFGWDVHKVNGHKCEEIVSAIHECTITKNNRPKIIIAQTIKGKGVSFMENERKWHAGHVSAEINRQIQSELGKN
jgi:transketolase